MAEQEIEEYESDPEEAKLSIKMRRREASDDEDGDEEEEEETRSGVRDKSKSLTRRIGGDSDGGESVGAAAEYDEDEDDEYVDDDEEEEIGGVEVVAMERAVKDGGGGGAVGESEEEEESKGVSGGKSEVTDQISKGNNVNVGVEDGGRNEGEKKEAEPYAVPTAGAFYMHDDRFRDNAGGRHRRTLGARRLWESKDNRKWGHDKFEELRTQDRNYEEVSNRTRASRGRGRSRGVGRGNARDNRPREYTNYSNQNNNNPIHAPKGVRGRGPRRYQPSSRNNKDDPLAQRKQSGKSMEKASYVSSRTTSESVSNAKSDVVLPRKQVFASSLNIASPPFYPSSSSTNDYNVTNGKDVQGGPVSRNGQPSAEGENIPTTQSTAMFRGKNIVDSIALEKLSIDDSLPATSGNSSNPMLMPFSGLPPVNSTQQFRAQGGQVSSFARMAYQPAVSNHSVNSQLRNAGQGRAQSSLQASSQQFSRHFSSRPRASSPPEATAAVDSFESGEMDSPSEPSKTALINKDKGSGGSFPYGGMQLMGASGNTGSGRGNQNFPSFLPVMQFGGRHPGGMGVPAVGMAFPGYVGQPQLGLGSSEMKWLPLLASAAGALGATYCPPYIAVDGSYHAQPSGQTPSVTAVSSEENNPTNDGKPVQNPELSNHVLGQRPKNPRRYTEMKFDQRSI